MNTSQEVVGNTPIFKEVYQFVKDVAPKHPNVSDDLKAAVNARVFRLLETNHYVRKNISSLSQGRVIDVSTKLVDGVSTFNEGNLPKGEAYVIDEISISYAAHADAGKEASLVYSTEAPASIVNATLKLVQKDKVIFSRPLCNYLTTNNENSQKDLFVPVKALMIIGDRYPVEMVLETASGSPIADPAVINGYLQVMFGGLSTILV